MENSKRKKSEGNIVVFEDLGIYSRDLVKDKEINKKLIEFLKSKGVKLGKIKIKD
jgi:hypothetical protein